MRDESDLLPIPNTTLVGYMNRAAKTNMIKLVATGDKTQLNQYRDSVDFLFQVCLSSLNMIQRL